MVVGTQRMDIPMAVGVQWMIDKPMTACSRYSGDNLDIGALYPLSTEKDKKAMDGDQIDSYSYSARELRSEGRDQPLSKANAVNA